MQVYLLPHYAGASGETIILGAKNIFGLKSKGKVGTKKIIPNNAGQLVISGGGLAPNEDPIKGAAREFAEETGIDLLNSSVRDQMDCEGKPIPLKVKVGPDTFWCVYQRVAPSSPLRSRADANIRLGKVYDDELHKAELALASEALEVFGPQPLEDWRLAQYNQLDLAQRADADSKMRDPYDWFIAAAMLIPEPAGS